MTTNKGIDYGLGQTNVDKETGIRFGVIPQHALNPDALEDVFQNGTDRDYEAYLDEVKTKLRHALDDYFSDRKIPGHDCSKLDAVVSDAFDAIQQEIADKYEGTGDCTRMDYTEDGLHIQTDSQGDVWVLKSPFYTHAQFCSPCAPGACYLTSPCDDGAKAYCLGADWFDDDKLPYPVYSVETGEFLPHGK